MMLPYILKPNWEKTKGIKLTKKEKRQVVQKAFETLNLPFSSARKVNLKEVQQYLKDLYNEEEEEVALPDTILSFDQQHLGKKNSHLQFIIEQQ